MKPYLDLLSFIQVKNSLYDLNSTFEDLTTLAKEDNAINVLLSNEYKVNNIVISLSHTDDVQNKEFIADAIKLNPIIIYDEPEIEVMKNHSNPKAPPVPPAPQIETVVLGGEGIHNSDFSAYCTAGFWVGSRTNSTPYLMTAGHCSRIGPFNPDGTFDFYHFPWGSSGGGLLIGSMAPPNWSVAIADMLRIYGTVELDTAGSLVCKSGYRTHNTCSEIVAFGVRVINLRGNEFNGIIKIKEFALQGESGAPVFPFVEEMLPGIFIMGMLTGGIIGKFSYVAPIGKLITDDIYILTG
ncbi:22613_t:CDS:2 [Gigaspora margarita]|uniref:22613_t:CDS:1 n=1 Tax=Gigaspora margarita TaxID=4874 RepID=A0ABN7UI04_GIGMA|nr:22613_t:CDS:2 [Gigaspora margarita]